MMRPRVDGAAASSLAGAVASSSPAAMAVLAIAAMSACGGGSTPVSPGPSPTPVPPSISFTPENERPEADTILLSMTASDSDSFTLVLSANDVTDLYGYGLDIVFDPTIIAFDAFAAAGFFGGNDIVVATQVAESVPGRLVVGQSRVGLVSGVSSSGAMLSLGFKAVSSGTIPITIESAAAFDSSGAEQTMEFLGGSLTVPFSGR